MSEKGSYEIPKSIVGCMALFYEIPKSIVGCMAHWVGYPKMTGRSLILSPLLDAW